MKENITAAFSAYEPVHYKSFQGALDAFFEQECPQIGGSRTRQTLVNLRLGHLSYKVKKDLKSWCFRIIL